MNPAPHEWMIAVPKLKTPLQCRYHVSLASLRISYPAPWTGFEAEGCVSILLKSRGLPLPCAGGEPLIAHQAKFPPGTVQPAH